MSSTTTDSIDLQQQFFAHIKASLPKHLSLADELCELLDISSDSAYRRIRGEKPLSLNEIKLLCDKFHVSMDQLLQLKSNSIVFFAPDINQRQMEFGVYLKGVLGQMKYFNSFKERKLLYLCKDMPIFQFFYFPEIAAFKTFFWLKSLFNDKSMATEKYSFDKYPFTEHFETGQQILKEYNILPSIELWNVESINSTVHQIIYYRDSGMFATRNDFENVKQSFQKTIDHIENQTEVGCKFFPGATDVSHFASLQLYFNEVMLGSNSIYTELDGKRSSIVAYNVMDYIMTSDQRFTDRSFDYFYTLVSRGTLLSATGERERRKFFRAMRDKVDAL